MYKSSKRTGAGSKAPGSEVGDIGEATSQAATPQPPNRAGSVVACCSVSSMCVFACATVTPRDPPPAPARPSLRGS
eukprot:scaffold256_cov121-Isochrysis_galbana.AAC.11